MKKRGIWCAKMIMIPANGVLPQQNKGDKPYSGFERPSTHYRNASHGSGRGTSGRARPASRKATQQLPDIHMEFRAAGSPHVCMQANDQVASRQVFALPPKNLARNALDQIAPIGTLDQFLGHRHAQAGGIQFV